MGRFSRAERDRRWSAVRSLMERAGLDALVAVDYANASYLSQLPGAGPVVLGLRAGPTAFAPDSLVPGPDDWTPDLRPQGDSWAMAVVERLRELGVEGGIIGITGLDPLLDRPDGDLNYTSFVILREELPRARWVGASGLLREVRAIKSGEEVAALRDAARVAEQGLAAALAAIAPETVDRDIWAATLAALLRAGADPGASLAVDLWRPGQPLLRLRRPQGLRLQAGDLLGLHLEASCDDYRAGLSQSVSLSASLSAWPDAWSALAACWERLRASAAPGQPLADLTAVAGRSVPAPYSAHLRLRGLGLGDDLPLIAGTRIVGSELEGPLLREGEAFLLIAEIAWAEAGHQRRLAWGEGVTVTAGGLARLGTRDLHRVER